MKKPLRRFTVCLALACLPTAEGRGQTQATATNVRPGDAASATSEETLTPAERLLRNVLTQLEARSSISASLLQEASLGGRTLKAGGRYLQLRDSTRDQLLVRLQLQGEVNGTPISLLQVSNGDRLWTDRTTPVGREVTGVDLRHIRRRVDSTSPELAGLAAGQARGMLVQTELSAEYGGLPMLIAGLYQSFNFSTPVTLRLSDVLVWATIGTWKPDVFTMLHGPGDDDSAETTSIGLPPHIPASVMLLIGQDDSFPYVVEYRRGDGLPPASPQDNSQYQFRAKPLMLLRLYERSFDTPIPVGEFDYSPGDAEWIDLTAARLERLEQVRKQRLAILQRNQR